MTLEALPAGNYQVAVGATRRAQPEGELSTTIYSAAQPTLKQRVGLHRPAGLASARLNDRLDLANHCDTMLLKYFSKKEVRVLFPGSSLRVVGLVTSAPNLKPKTRPAEGSSKFSSGLI